jgi:hypothetical protein
MTPTFPTSGVSGHAGAVHTAEKLLKLNDDERDRGRRVAVGDTWYRLTSRAKSKVGRALISALVK